MIAVRVALVVLLSATSVFAKGSVKQCAREPKPRDRAYCLLLTDDRAAIPKLLDVARGLAAQDPDLSIGAAEDLFYAAENAGVIAAKTSADDLLKLGDDGLATQLFALRSLGHMLAILRWGYAKGHATDNKVLADRKPLVAKACLARFGASDERVVGEAARCVGQTEDTQYAADLVKLVIAVPSSGLKREVMSALHGLPLDASDLRPLVAQLAIPIPAHWTEEIRLDGDICELLGGFVKATDTWAQEPARFAIREIGDRDSQAKDRCAELITHAGGKLTARETPAPSAPDWFPESNLSKCHMYKFGKPTLELCALSSPDGPQRRKFSVTFRDTSKLDIPLKNGRRNPQDGEHHLVHRIDIPAVTAEYMLYETTTPFELSDTISLIFVPLVTGTPDHYGSVRTLLYLFDATTQRARLAWESPACEACTDPTIQLRSKQGSPTRQLLVILQHDGKPQTTTLAWDGKALHP